MFYWKKFHVDESDTKIIQDLYHTHMPDNEFFLQQINLNLTHFLGLEVQQFVLIQVKPKAVGRIHTDHRLSKYGGYQLALQIPLLNCENSTTIFWSSNYSPPLQYTTNGQPYNYFDPSRCIKITEFNLTEPTFFRTDIPHSVNNPTDTVRKAISIRFKQDPWHLIK